jgi:molybdate transport system ATP-binding protein
MNTPLVHIQNFNLKHGYKTVLTGLNWTVQKGENWLLSGESGSGKTSLLKAIAGLEKSTDDIVVVFDGEGDTQPVSQFIAQWYQFKNVEGIANFYYQQRYNAQQVKDTVTVYTEIATFAKENNLALPKAEPILEALGFTSLKNRQLIELSSGEHKKLQLVKALLLEPQLLLLDQPYTGLDVNSRANLNALLNNAAAEGVQIVLVSSELEIPSCINRFAQLSNGKLEVFEEHPTQQEIKVEEKTIPSFLIEVPTSTSQSLVKMADVNISYGEKQVLKNINWEIKAGEKWLLQGHNGSGKSTLLSLINGDHPQAYANDITLFGNPRGSGESIWDIKQHIGLISPELHWYFDFNATVFDSIASGFFDSIGMFQKLVGYQKTVQVNELMDYFDLSNHKNEALGTLSLGKQRLVLLARTIIKNPELLILDEPCQGLDRVQAQQFNDLIDGLCTTNRTLIYVSHNDDQLPKKLTNQLILNQGKAIENKTYSYKEELVIA